MTKFISLLAGFFLITIGSICSQQPDTDRLHDQWLQERYFEAASIKAGMTRADLIEVFRMDGGLQLSLPTRYVLKRSNLIKVDVEFEIPAGAGSKVVPEANDKLKIKSISRPYVEPFITD
jgi:hypothetical protein